MFRTILVPLDGSKFGEHALTIARQIAGRAGATLRLVHVHVPLMDHALEELPVFSSTLDPQDYAADHAYLDRVEAGHAGEQKVPATVAVLEGPIVEALLEEIEASEADLVVMTTHGRGGISRLWLGSVTGGLLHRVTVPILLLRPSEAAGLPPVDRPFGQIVIPLDGSSRAEAVIDEATTLGMLVGARYTLVRVVAPFVLHDDAVLAAAPELMPLMEQATAAGCAEAGKYLDAVAERMRATGLAVRTRVVVGPAAPAILEAAAEEHADLIAMATHGRGATGRLLIGSVADKVVRSATVPILLRRTREYPLT